MCSDATLLTVAHLMPLCLTASCHQADILSHALHSQALAQAHVAEPIPVEHLKQALLRASEGGRLQVIQ